MAKKSTSKNVTLKRLTGTPFKTGAELKIAEDQILREEWKNIERARVRRNLLRLETNKEILAPFTKGLQAKFVNEDGQHEQVVKVYLTEDEAIQVEIDHELKVKDYAASIESIVKSLVEGLMGGYFKALGLKGETDFDEIKKSLNK
jgi:hypothetical protein